VLVIDNTDGEYDPNNSGATHYGDLNLGTPVRIRATYNAVTYGLFFGHVSRWPLAYETPNEARIELEVTEGLAIIRRFHLEAQAYSEESVDTRIGNILDDVGWPAPPRDLDTAVTDKVAAITYTGTAGGLLDQVVDAEQGTLFMAGDRAVTFYNRVHYSSATAVATFSDDGADIPYSDPELAYTDDLLVNDSTVTGADGVAASASDATSIATYGPSPSDLGTIDNEVIHSEPYALGVAEWLVAKYKDIAVQVVGLTIWPQKAPSTIWPQALGRDLGDVVNVEFTPPNSDTLDQDVRIEQITHEVTPGFWRTSFGVYPLASIETNDYWILGTSQLGTGTVLA
jgi:hypothetical protein